MRTAVDVRPPDLVIGRASDPEPYMLRWHLWKRNRFFNAYLHHVLASDDPVNHDHPFASVSLCLDGCLGEVYLKGDWERFRIVEIGEIVLRRATHTHRLCVVDGPAWTVFVTGPRVREWGFACPQGWRPWKQYVNARDRGQVGAGCGEA